MEINAVNRKSLRTTTNGIQLGDVKSYLAHKPAINIYFTGYMVGFFLCQT